RPTRTTRARSCAARTRTASSTAARRAPIRSRPRPRATSTASSATPTRSTGSRPARSGASQSSVICGKRRSMATVPMDLGTVARCAGTAGAMGADVQRSTDRHTTVGVERTIMRAFGVDGVDDQGVPLVNVAVDRYHKAGLLGRGISFWLARALAGGAKDLQEAAERLAYAPDLDRGDDNPISAGQARALLAVYADEASQPIDTARAEREALKARVRPGETPLKYVIVATGNIYDDAVQAKAAGHAGADIVAVIRATAQSLLDYVPHGATTEGFGGTFATQEN